MSDRPLRKLTEAGRNAANEVSAYTLKLARPLFWHIGARNNGIPSGASAFILQFEDRYIGVTADHVVNAFLEDKAKGARMICQLGTSGIDLEASLIARGVPNSTSPRS